MDKLKDIQELTEMKGRGCHRFLQQECYRLYSQQGYIVELEKVLPNARRADLFLTKNNKTIIIECFVRPTLNITKEKIESYEGFADEIIIAYPSSFIPNFPIEMYGTKLTIDVPIILSQNNTTIIISKKLRDNLAQLKYKLHMNDLFEVVQLLFNNADWEKFENSYSGINAGEQIKTNKEVVEGNANPEATLNNQFALNVKRDSQ